ncbi:DUF4167 domain-containing protein [Glycocaulis abyssi]|uniref:DUF4167 domain-containing protein n=1 Tax=Glycocaulis abyssi TaxID=1433403 RepID=A0ABV9NA66_9PROT
MKRQRGRGRKPSHNQGNRNFESNGPDVKIRGNAAHIYEKYLQLARDASSSGDRVMAENYYQHAEHYFRIVQLTQPRREERDNNSDDDSDDGDDGDSRNTHQQSRNGGDGDNAERSDNQGNGERQPRGRRPSRRPGGENRQDAGADNAGSDPLRMVDPGTAGGDSPPASQGSEQPGDDAPRPARTRRPRRTRADAEAEAALKSASGGDADAAA